MEEHNYTDAAIVEAAATIGAVYELDPVSISVGVALGMEISREAPGFWQHMVKTSSAPPIEDAAGIIGRMRRIAFDAGTE
jgi:hypothetical protein|tara:strand:+ start:8866 stop:9105 length:240 start_codon:yes stop_codon:yes gene_type:complete